MKMRGFSYFVAGATTFTISLVTTAKCIDAPSVLSEVRVESCQVAAFSNSFEAYEGIGVYETKSVAKGIIIGVQIEKSWLAWRRESSVPKLSAEFDQKPNQKNSFGVFYIHGGSAVSCKEVVGKQATIATADQCCDTVPRTGSCAVQLNQVVLLKTTTGYLPLPESK